MKTLEFFNKYKNFIISSHDAGGGNVLASLVLKLGIVSRSFFIINGPSVPIYDKKFKDYKKISLSEIPSFDPKETLVLTSTSGDAELERDVLSFARTNYFTTATILDHWSNFKIRFVPVKSRDNVDQLFLSLLPDYVLVTDQKAYSIALDLAIPQEKLVQLENPYLEELKNIYKDVCSRISKKNRVLYMSEYFTSLEEGKFTELDYLRDLLTQFDEQVKKTNSNIEFYIRLHPSEAVNKYDSLLKLYPFVTLGSKELDLLEDLATSRVVVGKSSMGLVVSAMLGIPTFSFLHPYFEIDDLGNSIIATEYIRDIGVF